MAAATGQLDLCQRERGREGREREKKREREGRVVRLSRGMRFSSFSFPRGFGMPCNQGSFLKQALIITAAAKGVPALNPGHRHDQYRGNRSLLFFIKWVYVNMVGANADY